MGFLLTVTMGFLFTMTLGFQLTISIFTALGIGAVRIPARQAPQYVLAGFRCLFAT